MKKWQTIIKDNEIFMSFFEDYRDTVDVTNDLINKGFYKRRKVNSKSKALPRVNYCYRIWKSYGYFDENIKKEKIEYTTKKGKKIRKISFIRFKGNFNPFFHLLENKGIKLDDNNKKMIKQILEKYRERIIKEKNYKNFFERCFGILSELYFESLPINFEFSPLNFEYKIFHYEKKISNWAKQHLEILEKITLLKNDEEISSDSLGWLKRKLTFRHSKIGYSIIINIEKNFRLISPKRRDYIWRKIQEEWNKYVEDKLKGRSFFRNQPSTPR